MATKKSGGTPTQKGQNLADLTEDQARAMVEKLLWPNGPACRHCGSVNVYRMEGTSCRPGLLRCRDCKKQFTVTVGTIFEDSHIPLRMWVRAFHLMCSSKKGISALQLQRNLGLGSYKTAWHLAHRIRLAMKYEPVNGLLKGIVEVDETYVGGKPRPGNNTPPAQRGRGTKKAPVVALIQRDGDVRTPVVPNVTGATLKAAIREHVDPESTICTDGYPAYNGLRKEFDKHWVVDHGAGEYVRGRAHVNTCESFFGLLKRGLVGAFHHVSKEHLPRYLDEFAFRWNNRKAKDVARTETALKQVEGKRLMFKQPPGGNAIV